MGAVRGAVCPHSRLRAGFGDKNAARLFNFKVLAILRSDSCIGLVAVSVFQANMADYW